MKGRPIQHKIGENVKICTLLLARILARENKTQSAASNIIQSAKELTNSH